MTYPEFSSFRSILTKWDETAQLIQVKSLLETNGLVMFFKKGKDIFGAPETSRLTFAKMKSPDEETPEGWADEASFMAFDLGKALKGTKVQMVFNNKDISKLKILDQSEVEKLLSKDAGGVIPDLDDDDVVPTAPENQPGIAKVDEE